MATSISARLARTQKKDVFNSSSIALVSKLRQEGQLNSVENVMKSIDQVSKLLSSGIEGYSLTDSILNMCQHLKVYGACLEVLYKDQLDKAFVVFRNGSQNEQLDYTSRLHLLELIELRANQWKGTDVMSQYYRKKINHEMEMSANEPQVAMESSVLMSPVSPPILGPGEIMKSSGKFPKPTRIPGKNYCKDEVVIRNADSGKVMGIKGRRVHMIEEISETIISFQRVNPGAKERLVQITGANESSINHAKQLIEDTIRRNASPIRDSNMNIGTLAGSSSSLNSSGSEDSVPGIMPGRGNLLHSFSTNDANVGEYKYTVTIGNTDTIKITGHNLDLVRLGKIVLDEYFNGRAMNHGSTEFFTVDAMPRSPISPIESNENESNLFLNGSAMQEPVTPIIEDEYKPIRKPNLKLDLSQVQKTTENKGVQNSSPDKVKRQYSHECLVRMSMSPKAICAPDNWEKITNQHPEIVRKTVEVFDADQYLTQRKSMAHALCTSASDDSILSGSSV